MCSVQRDRGLWGICLHFHSFFPWEDSGAKDEKVLWGAGFFSLALWLAVPSWCKQGLKNPCLWFKNHVSSIVINEKNPKQWGLFYISNSTNTVIKGSYGDVCLCVSAESAAKCETHTHTHTQLVHSAYYNQHPTRAPITITGLVITAAALQPVKSWVSDDVIRMLSSHRLMRGSLRVRGYSHEHDATWIDLQTFIQKGHFDSLGGKCLTGCS